MNEKTEKLSKGFLKTVTSLKLVNSHLQDHGAKIATLKGHSALQLEQLQVPLSLDVNELPLADIEAKNPILEIKMFNGDEETKKETLSADGP